MGLAVMLSNTGSGDIWDWRSCCHRNDQKVCEVSSTIYLTIQQGIQLLKDQLNIQRNIGQHKVSNDQLNIQTCTLRDIG